MMLRAVLPRRIPWSPKTSHGSTRLFSPRVASARSFASTPQLKSKDPTELDQVTTLPNGVRVATEALPGPFSAVGVYLDAGSRYENDELRGVSHIIDRLAFKSTSSRSGDQMLEALESLGGNMNCASSRETLMYQAATFNSQVPAATGLLAETIRDPSITDVEVQQQLETADYEIGEIWSKPELILPELVHVAAYKDNTLGNPLLCPKDRLAYIDRSVVETYRRVFFQPDRMVVAFAGLPHEEAVKLSEQYFGDLQRAQTSSMSSQVGTESTNNPQSHLQASQGTSYVPPQEPSKLLHNIPFFKNLSTSASQQATVSSLDATSSSQLSQTSQHPNLTLPSHYTGGFLSLDPIPPPPNPNLPRLSYINLAFEALPITSKDIYALATLQTLLGGGGSFSAGGPGKGMYSRLYTNVLNQYGWCENCVAFNHTYTDSGVFGISAACSPSRVDQMLEVMCRELHSLTLDSGFAALQEGEVLRAKNQLKSSLLMNLESRMVELEDLGRQVQVHGAKIPVTEMCDLIDQLTVQDLRNVAKSVLTGKLQNKGMGTGAPTVVLQEGEEEGRSLKQFQWGEIQERIARWQLGRR